MTPSRPALPTRLLIAACLLGVATTFTAFGLTWQSAMDISELRRQEARWNTARPVIEDALAAMSVSSLAATLTSVLILAGWWWQRRAFRPAAPAPLPLLAGFSIVAIGGVLWFVAASLAAGVRVLVDPVAARPALEVFNDYETYETAWRLQSVAMLVVSAGWLTAEMGALAARRRDHRPAI